MCIIAFAWQTDPDLRLLMIANRDEFHDRPTAPLARWPGDARIIAGRDLQAGGSWMGINHHGHVAAVTNVRTGLAPPAGKRSRGVLVSHFLESGLTARAAALHRAEDAAAFAPFNLLLLDRQECWWLTNWPEPQTALVEPGIHSLSNGSIHSRWPKTDRLRAQLGERLAADHGADKDPLLKALRDERRPEDALLPVTGVPLEQERLVSPIFIRSNHYGTRASTLLRLDSGGGEITEHRWGPEGDPQGTSHFVMNCPA
jgi:uncharacterized protein with NRDE domain